AGVREGKRRGTVNGPPSSCRGDCLVPAQANVLIELRLASRCNIKRRTMSLLGQKRTLAVQNAMSAMGQKPTYALKQAMSALHPIATAKAKFRKRQCPLYPRKRTCAVHAPMSALGQERTLAICLVAPLL